MDIHFISSLTPDDEDRLAPALLDALKRDETNYTR